MTTMTRTPTPVRPPSASRHDHLVLALSCLSLFMTSLDTSVVNLSLPAIGTTFATGAAGLQWVVDAYTLVFASLMLTGGTMGDRFGHKKLFIIGSAVFTLGSLACGVAPSLTVLVAARAAQAVCGALLNTSTLSLLSRTFPEPAARARAIGTWAVSAGVGLAAGPVVGGLLTSGPGWRWIFLVNLPVGVAAVAAAQRVFRATPPARDRALDLTGQFLAVVLLWSLTYAVIEAGRPGHALRAVVAGLAGLPLTWLLVRAERRAPSPMIDVELMRSRRVLAALFGAFAANFAYFGGLFVVSFYLQHQLGLSPTGAGLRFLPMTAAIVVMGPVAGRVSSRWGTRIPSTAGLATAAVGFAGAASLGPDTSYRVIAFWIAVIGLGAGSAITPLISAVVTAVPAQRAGMGSAIANTARNTGGVLGVAVLGALALHGDGPVGQQLAFLAGAGVLTVAAACFWVGTRHPH